MYLCARASVSACGSSVCARVCVCAYTAVACVGRDVLGFNFANF